MSDPFSQDILAEILKRLPIKSLLRLRCVRKSWYHLIQSPYFINLHCSHSKKKNKHLLLFQNRYRSYFSIRLDNKRWEEYCPQLRFPPLIRNTPRRSHYQTIYGTSRGLICVSIMMSDSQEKQLYLWNPVINKYRSLPNPPVPSNDQPCFHCVGLAFGYIGQIDDYKVIKLDINYGVQSEELQSDYAYVYIYSLSTNSWKTVGKYDFARFRSYWPLYNSVVVNGVAYWVLIKRYLEENVENCFKVIVCFDTFFFFLLSCFDTFKETIREIMLPPMHSTDNRNSLDYVNLVEEFGEVSLLCVDVNKEICDLWLIEKEGETNKGWTKMITVNLTDVGEEWCPIGFNNNLELVLISYDIDKPGFCSYDPETEEVTEMVNDSSDLWSYAEFEDPNNPRYDYGCWGPFSYSQEEMQPMYVNFFEETLVLLGEEGEVEFQDD